jgi:glycolate oxidase FAD binding subunit
MSTTLAHAALAAGHLAPTDEDCMREVVASAASARRKFRIIGNDTMAASMAPGDAADTLSLTHLTGITLYAPKELIVSVRAGTPVTTLTRTLLEAGQHLIAEPPAYAFFGPDVAARQTVGGMVAANLSGPRRVAWGGTSDHLIGVRSINGNGELIRSGGRVLKNVTGLDLCKLLCGSFGTLSVLTEVTLKVLPAPETSASLAVVGLDAAAAVGVLSAALGAPYGVSAAAFLPEAAARRVPTLSGLGGSAALVRIEDFAPSVAYRIGQLKSDLAIAAPGAGIERLDADASRAAWADIRDVRPLSVGGDDAVWRVSVRPSAGARVAAAAEAAFGASTMLDWGGGLVWVAGRADAAAHAAVAEAARAAGGVWWLMRGPEALRRAVDVVPPEPAALARITSAVRASLDPARIFSPGRLGALEVAI